MRSREMYSHCRQLVEELSTSGAADFTWFEELQVIAHQLELDASSLGQFSEKFLYDELCDQFEQEAYLTDNEHRRKVLLAATKLLEFQHPSAN